MSSLSDNPWTALFPSVEDAEKYAATWKKEKKVPKIEDEVPADNRAVKDVKLDLERKAINRRIEEIFLVTLDKNLLAGRPHRCVFLEDLFESLKEQSWLDTECLEQAVFERLMMEDPGSQVISTVNMKSHSPTAASSAGESNPVRYLYDSFIRARQLSKSNKASEMALYRQCENVIVMNTKLCFQHPEFFPMDIKPVEDFITIFSEGINGGDSDHTEEFFTLVANEINDNKDEGTVLEVFGPALDVIKQKFLQLKLGDRDVFVYVGMVLFFSKTLSLAEVLMSHIQPRDLASGRAYEETLLGCILSISCIVKNEAGPFEFFNNPSRFSKQEHDLTENNIHQPLVYLNEQVYQIIYNLLRASPEVKHNMLDWLGSCMQANKGRAKIWSNQMMPAIFNQLYASDGFFLNLCSVLLRLCKPFSEPKSAKLLKVQPTYCIATGVDKAKLRERNIHIKDLEETGLVPAPDGENERVKPDTNFNFMTECFFMTHYALHLGFHVAHERFIKLNQDLHRVQTIYQDVMGGGGQDSDLGQRVKEQMEKGMTVFLCLKAALTETQLLEHCFSFHIASATYLIHMATSTDHTKFSELEFPLPESSPPILACIPEFVAENIIDFTMFIKRFKDSMFNFVGDGLDHLMTMILVFMGSTNRMRNPHLRAKLAESLEALMPPKQDDSRTLVNHFKREQLFHSHMYIDNLAPTLLHVFVSIEMTGEGVAFEQKFNYRRPMYTILEYLWGIDKHRDVIKVLALHAEDHLEDTDSPLFLRFINLLMNDAIFLLDEALQYMAQIKEKQEERDGGAWSELPQQQRQETENNFRHMGMLARFHNMMSNDTIHSLEMISQDIKSIFTNKLIVDRITTMLNYFLLHLVGPKKKNLKVKNFEEFEFKPQEIVSNICQIYLNLGESDEFCLAVSRDGRAYSHGLFKQADLVLKKIHRPQEMIIQLAELAGKIKAMAVVQTEEEEVLADAPEEFLDPIMGTLMKDPVLLPTSGNIVDRTTIARHILSDQTDPFNRAPLTMDMVEPATELNSRITQWVAENKQRALDDKEED